MGLALLPTTTGQRQQLVKPLLSPESCSQRSAADTQEDDSHVCETPPQLTHSSTQTSSDASQLSASTNARMEIGVLNASMQSATGADCQLCGHFCDVAKRQGESDGTGELDCESCCLCRRQRTRHNTMTEDQDEDCMACSERNTFNLLEYELEDIASAGAASGEESDLSQRSALLDCQNTNGSTSEGRNSMLEGDRVKLRGRDERASGSVDRIAELVIERRAGRISQQAFQDAKRQVLEGMDNTLDEPGEGLGCCCFRA